MTFVTISELPCWIVTDVANTSSWKVGEPEDEIRNVDPESIKSDVVIAMRVLTLGIMSPIRKLSTTFHTLPVCSDTEVNRKTFPTTALLIVEN